ncbi:hypothetical protein [Bacteroides sp.]|uniref:hypothetical protein n=1 Tax=Bacteroides sp. TaxID=29523 RepID=UPI00262DB17C|nr:hypothetical protein [Bacteroides sp.]MDD3037206.1 hypothetical protein [Bacteroides sp.]
MWKFPSQLGPVRDDFYYKSENSPKVFRYHFSLNRAICEAMAMQQEEIHPFWRLPKFEDVTL